MGGRVQLSGRINPVAADQFGIGGKIGRRKMFGVQVNGAQMRHAPWHPGCGSARIGVRRIDDVGAFMHRHRHIVERIAVRRHAKDEGKVGLDQIGRHMVGNGLRGEHHDRLSP